MRRAIIAAMLAGGFLVSAGAASQQAKAKAPAAPANPVIVFETLKGAIEIELFQAEAPKSVAHILDLMKNGFYRGQRFHRVQSSLVQVGDPQSRLMSQQAYWGSGNSGSPIGIFELNKKRQHVRGTVGLAHSGDARSADSQLYIMKTASPSLDGKHAIIGRVAVGMAVVDKLVVTDIIKDISVK